MNKYSHQCSKCEKYGHGIVECDPLFSRGIPIVDIPVEKQCTISTCQHRDTHTTDGHQCRLCKRYGHSYNECNSIVK